MREYLCMENNNLYTGDLSVSSGVKKTTLKLKEDTGSSTTKTMNSTYSPNLSDLYQETVQYKLSSSAVNSKKMKTIKNIKMIISLFILLAVIGCVLYAIITHLPDTDSSKKKTTAEILQESSWKLNTGAAYDFSDNLTVTRVVNNQREAGTYELTDNNVLIMHFKNEELSYLIEYDSDGNMSWTHTYNGFEDVIYPEAVGK
jgi:hypothetical protein